MPQPIAENKKHFISRMKTIYMIILCGSQGKKIMSTAAEKDRVNDNG